MSNSIHKSYNSIAELPTEVRASFDETDQKKWMDLYNEKSDGKSDEDTVKESKEYAWLNMMDAPSGLAVETWGSVEVMDADGEVVNIDSLEEHCDDFINHGGRINEDHSNLPIGSAWKWERAKNPETGQDGIKFWFNIYGNTQTTENARQEILSGEKRSVSIGADAPRGDYKCDEKGCYVERNVTDYYELSLCQSPSNPNANFIAINGETIQKSRKHNPGDIVVKISDMTVHKDYTVCPLQNVKRNLIKSGYKDTHITGKHDITVKGIKRDNLMKILNESVSKCRYREIAPGSYQIRMTKESKNVEIDPDKDIQQYIKFAMDNEYAYESNNKILLCKKCPESFFKQMYDKGYLQCVSNYWGFRGDEKIAEGGAMGVASTGAISTSYGGRKKKKKVKQ